MGDFHSGTNEIIIFHSQLPETSPICRQRTLHSCSEGDPPQIPGTSSCCRHKKIENAYVYVYLYYMYIHIVMEREI